MYPNPLTNGIHATRQHRCKSKCSAIDCWTGIPSLDGRLRKEREKAVHRYLGALHLHYSEGPHLHTSNPGWASMDSGRALRQSTSPSSTMAYEWWWANARYVNGIWIMGSQPRRGSKMAIEIGMDAEMQARMKEGPLERRWIIEHHNANSKTRIRYTARKTGTHQLEQDRSKAISRAEAIYTRNATTGLATSNTALERHSPTRKRDLTGQLG